MDNGSPHTATRVELEDTIVVASRLEQPPDAPLHELEFEVVALIGEDEADAKYAVCYCESADEFLVADIFGRIIEDDALAQEVLNGFLEHADDAQAGDVS
ncbi:MAG: hypothetical protein JO219_01420 [Candidatus Eremiobacteraeota bacterium]|nr:hypothetical protein [Candidatus Eremiobacteraeota bacterium]MBV8367265.1 hypothetical protein [Candidatus Eremiobacteraeota bacterium]